MDEYTNDNKTYGPLIAIFVILALLILSAYLVFQSAVNKMSNNDILIDERKKEIYINKTKRELDAQQVDIEEVSKKLDDLDINFDDVINELDL